MIPAPIVYWEVIRRVNHFNADYSKKLTVAAVVSIINESIQICQKNGAILYEVREDMAIDLEPLVERDKVLSIIKLKDKVQASLPEDQFKILRITAKAVSDKCSDPKEIIVRKIQHQKLSEALRSPFLKPSFEWEETIGIMNTHKNLDVYVNDFDIEYVTIDYIKKHPKFSAASLAFEGQYTEADGTIVSTDSGLYLDSADQMRIICDVAALIAARDLGDVTDFQTQLNKIMFSQQHFLGGNGGDQK